MRCPLCDKHHSGGCRATNKPPMHTHTRARRGFAQAWCVTCGRWEFIPDEIYDRLVGGNPLNEDAAHG